MTLSGWVADYLDPYDFINVVLSGHNITAANNQNLSQFDDPIFNRRMDAAARLSGSRRYAAYAKLDADIVREAAPIIPYAMPVFPDVASSRIFPPPRSPRRSASSTIASAARSFTDPPGFAHSAFA